MSRDTVNLSLYRASIRLESGHGISLRNAAGVILTALTGRAWLTMEGDIRDIDLAPGVAYQIERDGLTVVNALEPSVVEIRTVWGRRTPSGGWFGWTRRWLARAGRARARARMGRDFGRFLP